MKKMNNIKECIDCEERINCHDSTISWIFFLVGIVSTLAVRVVIVLEHINPIYGKIAWYIGITGFLVFFIYKFKIEISRSRTVLANGLIEKIHNRQELTDADYGIISSLLCGLSSNKDRINYFFIFSTSIITVILALYLDIFRK